MRGLFLPFWLREASAEDRKKYCALIAEDLENGGKIFSTTVAKIEPLSEWEKAFFESQSLAG